VYAVGCGEVEAWRSEIVSGLHLTGFGSLSQQNLLGWFFGVGFNFLMLEKSLKLGFLVVRVFLCRRFLSECMVT